MAVFRVPKHRNFTVMSNHHLRNRTLSLKAKGLLSLMLSLPEGWDYTLAGLAHICRDGLSSIRATIGELEEHGYLRRRRLRNEKGQLTDTEYTILELPEPPLAPDSSDEPGAPPSPICENRTQAEEPICDFQTLDNPTLGFPALDSPAQEKPVLENRTQLNTQLSSTHSSNKNESNTHGSSIHPINHTPAQGDRMDSMDKIAIYRDLIMDNIDYDILSDRYGRERLDEVVELMLETIFSRREYTRVAGDEYPREVVKSRLLKVTSQHVEYVFDCLDKNTTKVYNIKAYLLTALYNAPATIDSFYRAEVNHDLYGGGTL